MDFTPCNVFLQGCSKEVQIVRRFSDIFLVKIEESNWLEIFRTRFRKAKKFFVNIEWVNP